MQPSIAEIFIMEPKAKKAPGQNETGLLGTQNGKAKITLCSLTQICYHEATLSNHLL
jgi:hypothetical protein